ncbi:MAG: 2-hydroxyacyl-CoA dehydratase [Sphingomonadales bacterium]|nr:MAG: 2-hydroxyacyl-CoA dehydratase [Sphingomonadales bacterium]
MSLVQTDRSRTGAPAKVQQEMAVTPEIRAHQKQWFSELHQRVADGEPYVLAPAVSPHEIFESFDIPYVCNEWWSGLTAARRQSAEYFNLLENRGYHDTLVRYGALSLGTALATKDEVSPPWGGLPKPAFVLYQGLNGTAARWENVAEAFDCPAFMTSAGADPKRVHHKWWEVSKWMWEELYDNARIDSIVEGYREIIAQCEKITGKKFDIDKLREVMDRANAQEDAFGEVRKIMQTAPKAPVSLAEELGNVMTIQWHRGSQWALDAAIKFRDEVKQRAADGVAVCPNERIRLMWGWLGLWQNIGFYRAYEQSHGAVFVRSIYMSIAIDGYTRYGTRDPLRALAARYAGISTELTVPPADTGWAVHEAQEYRCNGAVILPSDTKLMERALEDAGIPTMVIPVDPVDGRTWDEERVSDMMQDFLENRVAKTL